MKLSGTEYELFPVPPYLSPYSARIGELLKLKPANFEEAQKQSEEIDKLMEKLFEGTVTPKPNKTDSLRLFNAIIDLTNEVMQEAKFFRTTKRCDADKSRGNESTNPQTSEQNIES